EVDQRVVPHDLRLGRVDEPHTAHVGRQLVHDVERARVERHGCLAGASVPQIEQAKIVRGGRCELGDLDVCPANPMSFLLEPTNEVTRNEAARSTYQHSLHRNLSDQSLVATTIIATVLARICAMAPNSPA